MSEALAILRIGITCPIGLDGAQTASSIRAGVTRKSETPLLDGQFEPIVMGHLADELLPPLGAWIWRAKDIDPLTARMIQLATLPLREVLAKQFEALSVPLYLAAPPPLAGRSFLSESQLPVLAEQAKRKLDLPASRIFAGGGASFFQALAAARDELLLPGRAKFVLVGGLDSYFDLDRLEALEREGRLRTRGPQDAFTPGEAASFMLLSTHAVCRRLSLAPLAWITSVSLAEQSEQQLLGEGLASAVASALAQGSGEPIRMVMAGLNGESKSAKEWGVAWLRNRERFADPVRIEHPAEYIGDAGAALAPLMLASATLLLRARMVAGPALVWARSDADQYGASVLYSGT